MEIEENKNQIKDHNETKTKQKIGMEQEEEDDDQNNNYNQFQNKNQSNNEEDGDEGDDSEEEDNEEEDEDQDIEEDGSEEGEEDEEDEDEEESMTEMQKQKKLEQQKNLEIQQQQEKQKESMQQTILFLQQKSQHIQKLLEKGKDVIVFQFSSDTIKYGFANEQYPQKIKNHIAYKIKEKQENSESCQYRDPISVNNDEFNTLANQIEEHLKMKGNFQQELKLQKGKTKQKQEVDLKKIMDIRTIREIEEDEDEILYEDEVYLVEGNPNWIVKRPIKYGYFNLNNGKENLRTVRNDLEKLTSYILREKLDISFKENKNYKVILILPDMFQREQVTQLVDMFLKDLEFSAIYLHLESVLATFGAYLNSGCVVDIGYQKINICCVEEGIILPNTMIRKNFGGDDIDSILFKLLGRKHSALFKKKGFKVDCGNFIDMQSLSTVKEKVCSMVNAEDHSNRIYEVNTIRNCQEEIYNVFHNESVYLAPQALFYKQAFNYLNKFNSINKHFYDCTDTYFDLYWDPEDYLEEYTGGKALGEFVAERDQQEEGKIIEENKSIQQEQNQTDNQQNQMEEEDQQLKKQESSKKGAAQGSQKRTRKKKGQQQQQSSNLGQDQEIFQQKKKLTTQQALDPFTMQDLDLLIGHSIGQCQDIESKKKMANQILLVGGSTKFPKFVDELEDRLIETLPIYCPEIDRVEVIDPFETREVSAINISWTGATVLPRLESTRDLWITRNRWVGYGVEEQEIELDENDKHVIKKVEKWSEFGIRVLREKVPFQW